jgi:acyl-CoA synthetase (AMP-forming)/AMP-acid ligase II
MTMPLQFPLMIKRNALIYGPEMASDFQGRRQNWRQFAERVARIAGGLQALGIKAGDRVAMLALNSDWYQEFFFATAWAGAVFVPINTRLAPPEVEYWLADSASKLLLIDDNNLLHIR